ncbi:M67 family metallopeptidase [Limnoglobus roseus]|uniref:Mov34/MPN/PAD-1 n=1 Tax=Limnoglobus roseus TaxID=2598579 RepID=A0A5C1AJY1_9BACT|nr:M67 family metallopeptidase [Limnoglobus roseus]QEL18985.1 Mov34/MPN/PAD-1 [Limnoglobus roseus]
MPPFRLVIPRPVFEEMLSHARADRPNECCGLLAGVVEANVGRVRKLHRLVNELASPVAFRSESRSLFAAMKAMRQAGTDVLAVYHSHPLSDPIPSRHDLAQNYSERVVNLIVGLVPEPPDVRAWWLNGTGYSAAEWRVEAVNPA